MVTQAARPAHKDTQNQTRPEPGPGQGRHRGRAERARRQRPSCDRAVTDPSQARTTDNADSQPSACSTTPRCHRRGLEPKLEAKKAALGLPSGPTRSRQPEVHPQGGRLLGTIGGLAHGTRDPHLEVDTTLYRCRILGGANFRVFLLGLSDGTPRAVDARAGDRAGSCRMALSHSRGHRRRADHSTGRNAASSRLPRFVTAHAASSHDLTGRQLPLVRVTSAKQA